MTARWVVIALLVTSACDKKQTDNAQGSAAGSAAVSGSAVATGSANASGSAAGSAAGSAMAAGSDALGSGAGSGHDAAATPDPWDTRPEDVATKIGQNAGDDLSKIDPWDKAPEPPKDLDKKTDVAKIEKPVEDKVDKVAIPTMGKTGNTGFEVIYNPGKKDSHNKLKEMFEKERIFEQVAEGLNKTIRLPRAVPINAVSCNAINAFYDPNGKRIIMCYELVEFFLGLFKPQAKSDAELGNAVVGATMFAFFHELGHGLIDVLELASTGAEEDAADELATLTLIGAGDEGIHMAISGAHWFRLQAKSGHVTPFWDEHSFDEKRFFNIVCLIYGSDPAKYAGFITSGNLPVGRAQRCPDEYAKKKKAWETLLAPHLTNGAAINVGYKPTIPVAEAPKNSNTDPWDDTTNELPRVPPPTPGSAAAPPPAPAAITCEQAADHAVSLIKLQAEIRGQAMTPKEREELKTKLETQLPAAREHIIAQCAKEKWNDALRKCVMDSKSFAQLSKCK